MNNILLLAATASIIALSGCAGMDNKVIGIAQTWCDQGELNRCRQVARDQVASGRRTEAEALEEFMVSCKRAARRHGLNEQECVTLAASPFDMQRTFDPALSPPGTYTAKPVQR